MSSFFFSTSGETLAFGDARGESTRGEASKRTRERGADEREEDKQVRQPAKQTDRGREEKKEDYRISRSRATEVGVAEAEVRKGGEEKTMRRDKSSQDKDKERRSKTSPNAKTKKAASSGKKGSGTGTGTGQHRVGLSSQGSLGAKTISAWESSERSNEHPRGYSSSQASAAVTQTANSTATSNARTPLNDDSSGTLPDNTAQPLADDTLVQIPTLLRVPSDAAEAPDGPKAPSTIDEDDGDDEWDSLIESVMGDEDGRKSGFTHSLRRSRTLSPKHASKERQSLAGEAGATDGEPFDELADFLDGDKVRQLARHPFTFSTSTSISASTSASTSLPLAIPYRVSGMSLNTPCAHRHNDRKFNPDI